MVGLLALTLRRGALKRLGWALGSVGIIATVLGFAGFAFAVSYAAILRRNDIDAVKIGTQTFFVTGAIGVLGAFAYLSVRG